MPIDAPSPGPVLLTGATGFIGSALHPVLLSRGYQVRCMSREPERAAETCPAWTWVPGDLEDEASLDGALDGCSAAMYLTHGMSGDRDDYRRRELEGAGRFAAAAGRAGLERIVYLGGVAPEGEPSEHLASRLDVGRLLREGPVPTVEVRASMVVGHGSASWFLVRDLAARLPIHLLPDWAESKTRPLALTDALEALVRALEMELPASAWFNAPGPDVLSVREMIGRTVELMGGTRPAAIEFPDDFPDLTVEFVGLFTRVDRGLAAELARGIMQDLVSTDRSIWEATRPALETTSFDDAVRTALADEEAAGEGPGAWGGVERVLRALR